MLKNNQNIQMEKWLKWAREIQSSAQTGLAFATNHYEEERSKQLLKLALKH
jgi:hypothetical protein